MHMGKTNIGKFQSLYFGCVRVVIDGNHRERDDKLE